MPVWRESELVLVWPRGQKSCFIYITSCFLNSNRTLNITLQALRRHHTTLSELLWKSSDRFRNFVRLSDLLKVPTCHKKTYFLASECVSDVHEVMTQLRSSLFWDVTQRRSVVRYRSFGTTYRFLDPWRLDPWVVPKRRLHYQSTLRNIQEERRSHLYRGGSLKSMCRIIKITQIKKGSV